MTNKREEVQPVKAASVEGVSVPECLCDEYGTNLCSIHKTHCVECGQKLQVKEVQPSVQSINSELLETLYEIADFAVGYGDVCEIIARRARKVIAKAEAALAAQSASVSVRDDEEIELELVKITKKDGTESYCYDTREYYKERIEKLTAELAAANSRLRRYGYIK